MGSLGIFVINNDNDETDMLSWISKTGNPNYVVTEFIDIKRNLACHFYISPDGNIVWFGYSENMAVSAPGEIPIRWSSDSSFEVGKQAEMQALLGPYALDVAKGMLARGFWGLAGIDVLFDDAGQGYTVDVDPRVTGTMPALIVSHGMMENYELDCGKFRKSTKWAFEGTAVELINKVDEHNRKNERVGRVVLFSVHELEANADGEVYTQLNIASFAKSSEAAEAQMNDFCSPHGSGRD
jgi:hypothetical protein